MPCWTSKLHTTYQIETRQWSRFCIGTYKETSLHSEIGIASNRCFVWVINQLPINCLQLGSWRAWIQKSRLILKSLCEVDYLNDGFEQSSLRVSNTLMIWFWSTITKHLPPQARELALATLLGLSQLQTPNEKNKIYTLYNSQLPKCHESSSSHQMSTYFFSHLRLWKTPLNPLGAEYQCIW
jgi:hypothetical protein